MITSRWVKKIVTFMCSQRENKFRSIISVLYKDYYYVRRQVSFTFVYDTILENKLISTKISITNRFDVSDVCISIAIKYLYISQSPCV